MLKKISLYFLTINMIYQYYEFFYWYLNDEQIQIELALNMGLLSFFSGIIFVLFVHISYFPKNIVNSAMIPTYPPLIMIFSVNLGLLIGVSNLYFFQIYKLPEALNVFRSYEFGSFLILISFLILYLSVGLFKNNNEDPNPVTQTNQLLTSGIYKYIRNPMYLALVIFQIGIGMALSFLHISLLAFFTIILLHYKIIKKEEIYLKNLFGDNYKNYLQNSRRWI